MNEIRRILISIALLKFVLVTSQAIPPVNNFSPSDYKGENQNWAVTQTVDKHIVVANNKGLLVYNGANWKLYPSPNETIIRSAEVIDGKIYTGSYMEFGSWEKDDYGRLIYTSLSDKLEIELLPDEEIWRILGIDNWVLFQSLKRLYVHNLTNNSVYAIEGSTTVPNASLLGQDIYFYKSGIGIFRIENGKDILVYKNASIFDDEIVGIFQEGEEILVLTSQNGFYRSQGNELVKWSTSSDDLLSELSIYTCRQLKHGGYALGTISHGLIHLNKDGDLLNHINQSNGLRNNTVLSVYEDADQNIWLGLDNGISHTDLNSPYSVYQDNMGAVGSVYASAVVDSVLYLGTNQGLYYKKLKTDPDFTMIPGTQGQVWSLNNIDGSLFCGHHTGTYLVEEDQARKISSIDGTWKISKYSDRSDLLIQGNYDGLYVLEKNNGLWQLKNKIQGFDHSSRYFEVFKDHVFVNHEYKGIFKLTTDPELKKVEEVTVDTLLIGHNSGMIHYGGDLLYAYKKGVFKYNVAQDRFIRDSLLSNAYTEEEYISGRMVADNSNKNLWFFSDPGIIYVSEGKLGNNPRLEQIPLSQDSRNGIIGYESISEFLDSDTYILANSSGYIAMDLTNISPVDYKVNIGSIAKTWRESGIVMRSDLQSSTTAELNSYENNLQISFYSPEYNKYQKPEYQYQLIGNHDGWSEWSETSIAGFDNLPSGDYTFNVRARIGDQISSNTASYSFTIKRPWYLSNFMQFMFVVLAFVISIIIHKLYQKYYHKQQARLIETNQREIELARLENEREIVRIKNEQLKAENRRKSKELAASTMSIVKKNELLSKVKEYIQTNLQGQESVLPLITIIDRNLNKNDDWELFKEAFNNADQKFLKKLKKLHPNLSPNDIKLCAYLRLNLSSKEIAPLLNISIRSVEIKRYRLRKKLGLVPEDNLANYILEL